MKRQRRHTVDRTHQLRLQHGQDAGHLHVIPQGISPLQLGLNRDDTSCSCFTLWKPADAVAGLEISAQPAKPLNVLMGKRNYVIEHKA